MGTIRTIDDKGGFLPDSSHDRTVSTSSPRVIVGVDGDYYLVFPTSYEAENFLVNLGVPTYDHAKHLCHCGGFENGVKINMSPKQ